MAASLSVYLFGDQTADFQDDLRALLLVKSNALLATLIDQATVSLQREIQSLPWSQREQLPSFGNLLDLLSIGASKPLHPALHLALSCLHHFGLYVW